MKDEIFQKETSKRRNSSTDMGDKKKRDKKKSRDNFFQRFYRHGFVVKLLSVVCMVSMFALFLVQLDMLWQEREYFIMELERRKDYLDFYNFQYPEFYNIAHEEETWCWDPDTLLLKVNTSLFVH